MIHWVVYDSMMSVDGAMNGNGRHHDPPHSLADPATVTVSASLDDVDAMLSLLQQGRLLPVS